MTNHNRIYKMYLDEWQDLAGIEMLRDGLAYLNSRVETRNENKTIDQLLEDWYDIYFEFYHPV